MRGYNSGYLGSGSLRPALDNKKDILDLISLKRELQAYLKTRKDERDRELKQTTGLTLLKNRIYYACSTLDEREVQIDNILKADTSAKLKDKLEICWIENTSPGGRATGELARIIGKYWNRLNRMDEAERGKLDYALSQPQKAEESNESAVVGVVVGDQPLVQLKSDIKAALDEQNSGALRSLLRLVGNHITPKQKVLQAALTYISSKRQEEDINHIITHKSQM